MGDERNRHDNAYKRIFENSELARQLLVHFSGEEFVKNLDYDSLTKFDKSFVTAEFIDNKSDIIFKAKFQDNDIFTYILIEFHSSINRFMPQRMLRYYGAKNFLKRVKNAES